MQRNKCSNCGVVNLATDQQCRRCGARLKFFEPVNAELAYDEGAEPKKRSILLRLAWIIGVTVAILIIWYVSILMSSDPLRPEHKVVVNKAIEVLELRGFSNDALVLRKFVSYRSTDSWWNQYLGHRDAYAATNFPFLVLTLYPQFFEDSIDDNERAAMLLHESYHLFGSGEEAALEGVWREKRRLGWTAENYAQSKVWHNTRELTMSNVPSLFQCGPDGRSDCTE